MEVGGRGCLSGASQRGPPQIGRQAHRRTQALRRLGRAPFFAAWPYRARAVGGCSNRSQNGVAAHLQTRVMVVQVMWSLLIGSGDCSTTSMTTHLWPPSRIQTSPPCSESIATSRVRDNAPSADHPASRHARSSDPRMVTVPHRAQAVGHAPRAASPLRRPSWSGPPVATESARHGTAAAKVGECCQRHWSQGHEGWSSAATNGAARSAH